MTALTDSQFKEWLEDYRRAWETGDPAAAARLFTPDARYEETPFDEPMLGNEAIYRYWDRGAAQSQKDISFSFRILATEESLGIAHWQASFLRVPSGRMVRLDGILAATFSPDRKCSLFREWWHREEHGS